MQALTSNLTAQAIFLQKHGFNSQQTEGLVEFVMSAIEHSKQNLATQQDVYSLQNNIRTIHEDTQIFQSRTIQEFVKVHHQIANLNDKIDRVEQKFDQKFIGVDKRFEQIDKRFEQVDKRFDLIDKRFEKADKRFEKIEETLDAFKQKFTDIEKSILKNTITLGSITVLTVTAATSILSLLN